ncbi:MAG: DUF4238 domain-containing protein [Ignavibacteria bacterium]|nr:DUF4238 domain-containing protein [Ignavibacteria bacterium]
MKENHHYVSQFYLRHFSPQNRKGLIWVYSNENVQLLSIDKHVASIENYYMIDTPEGQSNIIEKLLCKMETETGRIFKKIGQNNYDLTNNDYDTLLTFMSYLRARIPANKDSIDQSIILENKNILRILADNESLYSKEIGEDIVNPNTGKKISFPEFQDYIKKNLNSMNLGMSQNQFVKTIYSTSQVLKKIFIQMKWCFLLSPLDVYFITSDRPVFPFMNNWKQPYLPGFGLKEVEVYFPLTPHVCMMGTNNDLSVIKTVNTDTVNVINARIINNSYNYYYSNMNSELFAIQTKLTSNKIKPSFK